MAHRWRRLRGLGEVLGDFDGCGKGLPASGEWPPTFGMTSNVNPRDADEGLEPQAAPAVADAQPDDARDRDPAPDQALAAHDDERFLTRPASVAAARLRFAGLVLAVLVLHAALIAAFLWRDRHEGTQLAQVSETPVEIVQEIPKPEPPLPPPPPPPPEQKPPPPKPKEDLSPSFSAPRAPNDQKVETQKIQPKTSAPPAPRPPQEGQPTPKAQVAPPKEEAPADSKQDEAAKEEDKSKPDAEALDKAKPKVTKQAKTKEAKAAPKRKQKPNDLIASLSAPSLSPDISFSKPTPKSPVYGGTDDVRWMSQVEGMLVSKVGQLPRTAHWQSGGKVAIFFHVDPNGRVISKEILQKSGYPDIDAMAMRALMAAAPFPPPPPGIERGLVWGSTFDGQLPTVHVNKR